MIVVHQDFGHLLDSPPTSQVGVWGIYEDAQALPEGLPVLLRGDNHLIDILRATVEDYPHGVPAPVPRDLPVVLPAVHTSNPAPAEEPA